MRRRQRHARLHHGNSCSCSASDMARVNLNLAVRKAAMDWNVGGPLFLQGRCSNIRKAKREALDRISTPGD